MAERVKKTPEQALVRLMDTCAKCERSSHDARQSLWRWGVDAAEHDGILQVLQEQKFIDDARYAAAYVREKSNLNRWGRHKIKAGLAAKRIPETIIAEAMEQIDPGANISKLEDHLRRKIRTVKYKDSYDLRGKLLRYGTGLGFDYSEVAEAIERLVM